METSTTPAVKLLSITLRAVQIVEYRELIQVPADATPAELESLVTRRRGAIAPSQHAGRLKWDRATFGVLDNAQGESPDFAAQRLNGLLAVGSADPVPDGFIREHEFSDVGSNGLPIIECCHCERWLEDTYDTDFDTSCILRPIPVPPPKPSFIERLFGWCR
jgi:hypothetical protein